MTDDEAEYLILTTDAGRLLLDTVAKAGTIGVRDLENWRKTTDVEWVHAAVRLAESRRRGLAKFSRGDRMWFSLKGLEQATSERVAVHKASRFAGSTVFDLCAGIGGDAVALAATSDGVLVVDRDFGMLRRCLWNATVQGVGDRVLPVRSDAERLAIPAGARVHIDPDRRAAGARRARDLDGYQPGREFLARLVARQRGGAIKLGPASDFEDHFNASGLEIEITSLDGECKEATVWFGDLATCRRRATVLPSGATWTDRDGGGRPVAASLAAWVIDPDPALIRSGLLDGFAAASGWSRFADGVHLLTAPQATATPWGRFYQVKAELPLDLKTIRREVAARQIGRIDIKTRQTSHRPEELRKQLRLEGDRAATLFLIGGPGKSRAILADVPV